MRGEVETARAGLLSSCYLGSAARLYPQPARKACAPPGFSADGNCVMSNTASMACASGRWVLSVSPPKCKDLDLACAGVCRAPRLDKRAARRRLRRSAGRGGARRRGELEGLLSTKARGRSAGDSNLESVRSLRSVLYFHIPRSRAAEK